MVVERAIYASKQWVDVAVKNVSVCIETENLLSIEVREVRDGLRRVVAIVTVAKPICRGKLADALRALGVEVEG